ncbi:MAG: 30S ribosomal protein S4e [Methanomassiliicoccales archaeon]|nr:MAG: 30S ribosomal protein S4e [Methanomassiliicoccales archaeon]
MSSDMKRLMAPRSWAVPRKKSVWITGTNPGAHSKQTSMSLMVVIRDMLGLCDTYAEGKKILSNREVLVDGRVVTEERFPVGLMDVVSIPKLNQNYRMMLDRKGKFRLVPISEGKEKWKLCRIDGKTTLSGGKVQLNMNDGRCIIVEKDVWKCGDVVKIELPSQKILDTYRLAKGNVAFIISGSHVGELGVIDEYIIERSSAPNLVKMKDGILTIKENVFVVGNKVPEVILPEASAL